MLALFQHEDLLLHSDDLVLHVPHLHVKALSLHDRHGCLGQLPVDPIALPHQHLQVAVLLTEDLSLIGTVVLAATLMEDITCSMRACSASGSPGRSAGFKPVRHVGVKVRVCTAQLSETGMILIATEA